MLSCRFVLSCPLLASAVIGATSVVQLEELSIAAEQGALPGDVLKQIDEIHSLYPSPNP